MKYAFNDSGILRDVVQTDPALLFPAGYASQFITVPDDAQNGWLWDGTTATPPAGPTIEQQRAAKVTEIKAERDRRTREGGVPAGGKWFHSDVYTRSKFQELARRGPNIPPIPWRTMDGTDVTMTPALVLEILDSFFAQELNTFNRAKELEFFANTEPNPDGLVLNGWPPIFGE